MATTMPRSAGLFDSTGTLALDWSDLYDEHAPRLHRIAARRVGSEHAPDVVQEIFIRAYRNRATIDPAKPIGAWLSTIALRASTDALRRRSARPEVLVEDEGETALSDGDVDEQFENIVRREGIKVAFESLPPRQRRVFRHLAIDGWSQEEVAADEGMSTEAVKSLYARARHAFKETYQAFADRMGVFGGAAVGGAFWKLRSRIQRVQSLVGEHVGAFAAATATVTVVAIAAVPSTRAVPTMADESPVQPTVAPVPEQPSPDAGDPTGDAPSSSVVIATTTTSPVAPPPESGAAVSTTTTTDASATVANDGSTTSAVIDVDNEGSDGSDTVTSWLVVECEAGYAGTAMCAVTPTLPQ